MIFPQSNVNLQSINTLSVPAIAEFFYQAYSKDDLVQALLWARKNNHEVKVLGGGSNVLLADRVEGLVIQPLLNGVKINASERTEPKVLVTASAGENWHSFVEDCTKKSLYGLENLALIPGNVGSAPIQNIGAYGVELQDIFVGLRALNIESLQVEVFDLERCQFGYRDSVFKHEAEGKYIILEVTFELTREAAVNVQYPALQEWLLAAGVKSATPLDVFNAIVDVRSSKLPDPDKMPNVGSFFKNPIIHKAQFERLQSAFPQVVHYPLASGDVKLAAAWLIDQAGWKGKELFGVGVHEKQALVLVNPQGKSCRDVLALAVAIENSVQEKFGVALEIEPRVLK